MLSRAFAGFVLSMLVAGVARHVRALSPRGTVAAIAIGTVAVAAGWEWGVLLLVFFGTSIALSRWRRADKERRTAGVIAKGGERDEWQVVANGGVFALCAWGSLASASELWSVLGAGAIAAATADTWSTEIGTAKGGTPRSILSGRPVPPGLSGGVSVPGTAGALAGAILIALTAWVLGWPSSAVTGSIAGGIGGALLDSVLGATVQGRRWCSRCETITERRVHVCGTATELRGGIRWLTNDWVNLLSTFGGAAIAAMIALWYRGAG